jgi:transcriptional regulator with XRE-family HTH domain
MGYNYPLAQGQFYSIQRPFAAGYKCPMGMTFKEALEHAMRARSLKSVRGVAVSAGVSPDILKNVMQGKSSTPNAEAAAKIADFFGVSVKDFLAGSVDPQGNDIKVREDAATISELVRRLQRPEHRDQVEAFARALLQTEEAQRPSE